MAAVRRLHGLDRRSVPRAVSSSASAPSAHGARLLARCIPAARIGARNRRCLLQGLSDASAAAVLHRGSARSRCAGAHAAFSSTARPSRSSNEFGDIDTRARQRRGALPRRHAVSLAFSSCDRRRQRPLLLSSTVQPRQPADGRGPHQPGHLSSTGASSSRAAASTSSAPSSSGRVRATSAFTCATSRAKRSTSRSASLRRRLRRHLRGARTAPRAAGPPAGAAARRGLRRARLPGLDGVTRRTPIECKPEPQHVTATEMLFEAAARRASRAGRVAHRYLLRRHGGASARRLLRCAHARRPSGRAGERFSCSIETSNDQLNAWLYRSAADLQHAAHEHAERTVSLRRRAVVRYARSGATASSRHSKSCGSRHTSRAACSRSSRRRRRRHAIPSAMRSRARFCTKRAAARWRRYARFRSGATTGASTRPACS